MCFVEHPIKFKTWISMTGKPIAALFGLTLLCTISLAMSHNDNSSISIKDITGLINELLANHNKDIVPGLKGPFFNVTIFVYLLAVGEIDEIEEKVSTVMKFYYLWQDEFITWDLSKHKIGGIYLGWEKVWKPILRVSNPHTDENSQRQDKSSDIIYFDYEGNAIYEEMMTTRTTCDLDMTYYPFDIQSCDLNFFILGHSFGGFSLDVEVGKGFDVANAKHGSWNLISQTIKENRGEFTITLQFERRPLFILLNILLPIIVLALLTPIVFVLPKKSGERVGYAITMLLAISVYMTIVSDHLPENSQPMPLVSIMIFIWYILDSLIVFIVIINTKIHTMNENKPVPNISQKFVHLTRTMACQKRIGTKDSGTQDTTEKCIEIENAEKDKTDGAEDSDAPRTLDKITWQDLSHAIDKWCFVISYILKIMLPVIFFTVAKFHTNNE